MIRRFGLPAITVVAMAITGCGGAAPAPLRPQEFLAQRHPGMEPGMINRQTDQNGTLVYGDLHAPLLPDQYSDDPTGKAPIHISRIVQQATATTQPVIVPLATAPTSLPTSRTVPGLASNYQVVGTVILTVNGHPIYADKVLADPPLESRLAAAARQMDPATFRDAARVAIANKVQELKDNELYVAAANEFLSSDAKLQADRFAEIWRLQQITAAAGSLEAARESAIRQFGMTLDERVREERDRYLTQLYLEQKIMPLIVITADDMRRYYEQHLATEFTQTAAAKFHLIKIDIARRGGADQASQIVHRLLDRLRQGVDFSQIAKEYNDDPVLKNSDGAVAGGQWVQKGSYINELVENEVWKLHPGEFSEFEDHKPPDAAFFIAQLDARKPGTVRHFDDQDVQAQIRDTLRSRQFSLLQEKVVAKLAAQSFAPIRPDALETTVDMAMQRYAAWVAAR